MLFELDNELDIPVYKLLHIFVAIAQCSGGCQNGGTCTSPGVCICAPGWTGTNCGVGETITNALFINLSVWQLNECAVEFGVGKWEEGKRCGRVDGVGGR